jgi:hypothetical protein
VTSIEQSKRSKKRMIENTVNLLAGMIFNLPEIELVDLPSIHTTRFDEDRLEYEITIKVRAKASAPKRGGRRSIYRNAPPGYPERD